MKELFFYSPSLNSRKLIKTKLQPGDALVIAPNNKGKIVLRFWHFLGGDPENYDSYKTMLISEKKKEMELDFYYREETRDLLIDFFEQLLECKLTRVKETKTYIIEKIPYLKQGFYY